MSAWDIRERISMVAGIRVVVGDEGKGGCVVYITE